MKIMNEKLKEVVVFFQAVFASFSAHRAPRLAAALAYYALFSTAPLLVMAIAIAGQIVGQSAAQEVILDRVTATLGPAVAEALQGLVASISQPRATLLATAISAVVVLVGASNFYAALQDALNTIWDAHPPAMNIKTLVKHRGLAFVMVVGTGLILILFLFVSAVVSAVAGVIEQLIPGMLNGWTVWAVLQGIVFYGLATLIFAAIFRILPDTRIAWRDVWLAAVITTLLFTIGRFLLELYIRYSSFTSLYGAAGSLVALLVFVYYMAQIIFLGAEISRVYAERYGSRRPS
jgi:membrane protein